MELIFQLEKPEFLYEQLASHFESRIHSGELVPGQMIGQTSVLAKEFGVTVNTVQQAMSTLAKKGLLERIPGRGTYISRKIECRTMALVFGLDALCDSDMGFYRALMREIIKETRKRGWDVRIYTNFDERHAVKLGSEIETQIASGEIRAVIAFCCSGALNKWINGLNSVPITRLVDAVYIDYASMCSVGLDYLTRLGFRRISLLMGPSSDSFNKDIIGASQVFSAAGSVELSFHNAGGFMPDDGHRAKDGEALFDKLFSNEWSKGDALPDAVFIFNDNLCRGFMHRAIKCGLRIPDDLALITHANKDIEIFSPIPLTKMEIDTKGFSLPMVEHLIAQIKGMPFERRPVQPAFVKGCSCGERAV